MSARVRIRTRMTAAVLAASTALGLVALAASPAHAVTSRGVSIPDFYSPPATLPADDGALVRSEPFRLALNLPGITKPMPGSATRIMYRTTDSGGGAAAVTGAYLEPSKAWTGPGRRPLVVVAPGTMGQGDQCSTSLALQRGLVAGFADDRVTVSIGYEVLAIYGLLSRGIAVVETDYVGLGATDRLHTYVNRVDEAHAVLDAARAVRSLPGTSVAADSPVGLYGYSQGGGAVAAAAELQGTYAPDVPLKATYSGAPPADLAAVTAAIDGSELAGALGWSINGFEQSDPALRPLIDAYLSDAGRTALDDLSTMCVGDAVLGYADRRSSGWTTDGESLADIIAKEPLVRAFVDDQRIGTHRPAGVVRVASGVSDNLVPHAQARQLAVDWCARGANVTYAPVFLAPTVSPLLNHAGPLLADQGPAIGWISDRLAGRATASGCWAVPFQP